MKHSYLYDEKEPEENKSEDKKQNRRYILLFTAIASFLVLIICIIRLVIYSLSSYNASKNIDELKESIGSSELEYTTDEATGQSVLVTNPEYDGNIISKYSELYKKNNDFVGWISIEDTNVNYPVMQTLSDEEYYLHRNFDREESEEGLPFMDIRCEVRRPSTNLLVFGHNMKNGDMFADLLNYQDRDYYEKHKIIRFDTVYEEGFYEIIAVFRTRVAYKDENTFRFYNFIEADNETDFRYYMENIRHLSFYQTDSEAEFSDRLLTLSTCEYTEEDGRFVVVAKKLK